MAIHGDKQIKKTGRELAEVEGAVGLRDRHGFVPWGPDKFYSRPAQRVTGCVA